MTRVFAYVKPAHGSWREKTVESTPARLIYFVRLPIFRLDAGVYTGNRKRVEGDSNSIAVTNNLRSIEQRGDGLACPNAEVDAPIRHNERIRK